MLLRVAAEEEKSLVVAVVAVGGGCPVEDFLAPDLQLQVAVSPSLWLFGSPPARCWYLGLTAVVFAGPPSDLLLWRSRLSLRPVLVESALN